MLSNMRKERFEHGYTTFYVAKKIGVHPNSLRKWELGQVDPMARHLVALCNLYGCSAEYLLGLTDERTAYVVAS